MVTTAHAGASVQRVGPTLRADPRRTILRPFLPGDELVSVGLSRAESVIRRVLSLSDEEVAQTLPPLIRSLSARHPEARAVFDEHADYAELEAGHLTPERRELLGAFLTQEYAVEAAAVLNPSIVPHPDQGGLAADELRFVLTVRAIGEGHISSLEFRTGVVGGQGQIRMDAVGHQLVRPSVSAEAWPADYLDHAVRAAGGAVAGLTVRADGSDATAAGGTLTTEQVDALLQRLQADGAAPELLHQVRLAVETRYVARFRADSDVAERVLFPVSSAERGGVEDVRLVPFIEDGSGPLEYRGTYTAYDGAVVTSHQLSTADFRTFTASRLFGPAAHDKGMALFPRRVSGQLLSVARRNREALVLGASPDGDWWDDVGLLQRPRQAWEAVQLGTAAPPLATPEGWLVITHGVGAVRHYALGAMLLDLDDPLRVRGVLPEPLLVPTEEERIGYVPNVVYTCGGLLHGDLLVLPYACSDAFIRFAVHPLEPLLDRLLQSPPR
jgi:predicted GH43/DUF377 family glycosyl hydrolase